MNTVKEVKIVRWSIIFMIVVSSIALTVDYLIETSNSTTKISIMSGFGEISIDKSSKNSSLDENNFYQDEYLGFQISKPDKDWEFHSATDYLLERSPSLKSKGYLDGMYIEKQHDKRFLLTVFSIKENDFQLANYIENQIQQTKFQNVKIPLKQVSPSNSWAIFSMDSEKNDKFSYGEQLLFFKDNRLYMLQYTGYSPENITDNERGDVNFILNSFRVM